MKGKQGPLVVTFLCGFLMLLEWFFDAAWIRTLAAEVKAWAIILGAFALGLGGANLVKLHWENIVRRRQNWYGSVFMFISLILFSVLGIAMGTDHPTYQTMYWAVIAPAGVTMYSILGFFLISAGARSFRASKASSTVVLGAALVCLITQVPLGEEYFPWLVKFSNWLLNIVNLAGQRGIIIGAALGAFANAARVLTGIERVSSSQG